MSTTPNPQDDGSVTVELEDLQPGVTPPGGGDGAAGAAGDATPAAAAPAAAAPAVAPAEGEATNALSEAVRNAEKMRQSFEQTALTERQRADEAQRRAEQTAQELKAAQERVSDTELTLVTSRIESTTRDLENARAALEAASEAGEFAKAADAQVKISRAAAALDRLEAQKAQLEAVPRQPARQTTEGAVQRPAPASPFEGYVAGFTPRAQAWLRAHPDCVPAEFGGDPTRNAKMMAGHYAAIAAGEQPNSDKYFEIIEQHTGDRQPMSGAATVQPAAAAAAPAAAPPAAAAPPKPAAARAPQPSAPPSNGTDGTAARPTSIRLTPQQQEIAQISFPAREGETEAAWKKRAYGIYASELAAATQEGKIGRMTH